MAVAHSAASESHAATTGSVSQTAFSWTHTQTGTPQGVLVFVHVANSTGNPVSSVTYGSVTLTRVSGGAAIDSAGEAGRTDLFFAGSGLGTGNQTITVNRANTTDIMYASAATVTAATNTNVTGIVLLEGDGTLTVQSVTDGGAPTNSLRYAAAYSGLASPPPAGTGSTLLNSIDFGNYGIALVRETTAGTGARNVGFNNATTDDRAAVHVAVRELWNRTDTETVGAFTLTGQPNTLARGRVMTGEGGAFTLTGQPADLRHNPKVDGGTGAFTLAGQPADARHNVRIEAGTGTFSLTGNDATLTKAAAPAKTIAADRGQFTLTGNPASTLVAVQLGGDVGKFFLPERNVLLRSEEFNQATWGKVNATVSADVIAAPDGTITADMLVENTTSGEHFAEEALPVKTGNRYVLSCYAKGDGSGRSLVLRTALQGVAAVSFNLVNGTGSVNASNNLVSYGSTALADSWYRCWIAFDAIGTGTAVFRLQLYDNLGSFVYTGNGTASAYIWGAQLEQASAVSDYDPTGPAGAADAALLQQYKLTAEVGVFAHTGQPATLAKGRTITAETGAFTAAGQPATLRHNPRIEANTGSFALSGGSPALLRGRYLSGGAGEFIETGQPATFRRTWAVQAATGAFAFTGNPASLTELGAYEIDPIAGAFALSGQPASLAQSQTMPVDAGSFNLTGQPAMLRRNAALTPEVGQFATTSEPVGLIRARRLTPENGSFNSTSGQPNLLRGRRLAPTTGNISFTGISAELSAQSLKELLATAGAFALTAPSTSLSVGLRITPAAGNLALSGSAADLVVGGGPRLNAESGVFTFSANPAHTKAGKVLQTVATIYSLTGNNINFTDADVLFASAASYEISPGNTSLLKKRRRNIFIF